MVRYNAGRIDVAVIGAGHAGIEAALAAARLGCKTALFTLNLDAVANMPCNPAIGGTGKGQLVREIDALGGQMGISADAVCLQSRMLNEGKGPAAHSLRMQSDRTAYRAYMKKVIETQPNLRLIQAEIVALEAENGQIARVITALGAVWEVGAAVIASGTYLRGKIHVGEVNWAGGPDGMKSADSLTESLKALGVKMLRFKTGTPSRVDRKSIDFSKLQRQDSDEPPQAFSFMTDGLCDRRLPCYIAWTNEKTHAIIRANLSRSPLYGGVIEGIGPRYCPSIEDKVVRFADKPRHQIFVEPTAENSDEMYLQGMSSSLPEEVQLQFLHTIEGFENLRVMRTAYAIEYDCCDPTQLAPTLEFKALGGLYGAGQFNGTSGYEEAAAQGLVAGANAALKLRGRPPLLLTRADSYIGTLIDDIVTKGVLDPYRMMTSRCENRLILRQDNADLRLTPRGREIGLADDARWAKFTAKRALIDSELARLAATTIPASPALNALLLSAGCPEQDGGIRAAQLLKRPGITYAALAPLDPTRPENIDAGAAEYIETSIKYSGYIEIAEQRAVKLMKMENRLLPPDADYTKIETIRLETREKLQRIRPLSLGQAARISGVTPADISVLAVWLAAQKGGKE